MQMSVLSSSSCLVFHPLILIGNLVHRKSRPLEYWTTHLMILYPESQQKRNVHNNARGKKHKKSVKKLSGAKELKSVYLNTYFKVLQKLNLFHRRNVKLLSFGDDEGATEETEPVTFKKKGVFRPDCAYHLSLRLPSCSLTLVLYPVIDNHDHAMPNILAPVKSAPNKSDLSPIVSTADVMVCH
jgi:hypothetical protein